MIRFPVTRLMACLLAGSFLSWGQGVAPTISPGGVVNGADYTAAVAPGMIISVFGDSLASKVSSASAPPLPVLLDGTSVEVDGQAIPLFFVSPGQINAQMPFGISGQVQVRVRTSAGLSKAETTSVAVTAPRLFTKTMDGRGEPVLCHSADWSLVSAASPAQPGEYLTLFLTGLGAVSPVIAAGQAGGDNGKYGPLNEIPSGAATVTFGGKQAAISFAGLAPGWVGLYQLNFQVPADMIRGTFALVVSTKDGASQAGVQAATEGAVGGPAAHFTMSAQGKTASDGGALSLSMPTGGSNVAVSLASTSTAGSVAIATYVWRNNGAPICGNTAACTFNFSAESNTITLTVTDGNGLSSTVTGTVALSSQPVPIAHFTMSAQGKSASDGGTLSLSVPVNGNVDVSFTNTSTQGGVDITTYAWKRDGTPICGNSSTCTVNVSAASNTITLTVTDGNGQSSTATGTVALNFQAGPLAHYTMSGQGKSASDGGTLSLSVPVNGNVDVSFTSASTAGSAAIATYAWKNNGTTFCGNSAACTFNFATSSNTVTLTVTDGNGQSSTATGTVALNFQAGPLAHYTMSGQGKSASDGGTLSLVVPAGGNVAVEFASTTIPGSAAIAMYAWKNNGMPICASTPACTFNASAASNTVTLTVTDSNGLSSTATGTVALSFLTGPTAHYTMTAQGKSANDGGTLSLVVPAGGNVAVEFASTTIPGSAAIATYTWKNNGTAICGNTSTCTFNFSAASSTVTLTVTDGTGLNSTATGTVALISQAGTSWQWQLTTPVDLTVDAALYDIDLFENSASVVAALHAKGRRAICYMSAGTWEDWRPDANKFPSSVLGNSNGWPGEKWLDIRKLDILGPIMEARLDLCASKGFDGVEPDNVEGYTNDTGFPLTSQDQKNFNIFIANAAHARGLSVGLKNDLDQVQTLLPYFDWALNEQCFEYKECNLLLPFINAGKEVFEVEYSLATSQFCAEANKLGFNAIKKNVDLDAYREPCR